MITGSITQYLLTFLAVVLSLFYVYLRRNFNYWKTRGVPYDEPNILFGNVSFLMRKSFSEYFYELGQKCSNDYLGIYLGWKPALVVQTPELAKRILMKDFNHFQNRMCYCDYESDSLGSLNLFAVKNPIWSKVRHEISPMFTSSKLKSVTDIMNGNAKELVEKIQRNIDRKEPIKLMELFSMYTSDTVGSTVFGLKVSALNDSSSPLWYITQHMVHWTFWRGFEFTMIFMIPAVAAFMRLKFFSVAATEYIKKLFWAVAKERQAAATDGNDSKDLVNHLLKLRNNVKLPAEESSQLADDIMLAQAAVFILGAIETSSTTLSYCFHELAQHPEEQQKLHEEVTEALQRTGKDILEYGDLIELKYLTACILETLRKYPPVPHLDRMCNQTYTLDGAVTVEKGTPVFVNVRAIHYDQRNFQDPHQWKPERLYDVHETDNLNFSLLPFGDGPRFCIGKRYGVMQIRAAVAQIITKYKIERDPTVPLELKPDPYSVMLSPLNGGRVKFVPRH